MTRVLVVLQNAWRRNARPGQVSWSLVYPERSRQLWERALWRSHTGKRLKGMLPENCEVRVGEASPKVANNPRDVFPMEPAHVRQQVEEWKPDVALLLGKEAQKAKVLVEGMGVRVVVGPHPAYRLLSKAMAAEVRQKVAQAIAGKEGD